MDKLRKDKLKEVARIYAGSLLVFIDASPFFNDLDDDDAEIVVKEVHAIGQKLLRKDNALGAVDQVIDYVKLTKQPSIT